MRTRFLALLFALAGTGAAQTITTILGTDTISGSRTTINNNFSQLNLYTWKLHVANDVTEISTPGTNPSAGYLRVYAKTGSGICWKTSAGVESCAGSAGLADPGSNGIVKRTALNVTAVATAGTDYYAPGGAIASSDLPFPGASAKGSILTTACSSGQYVTAYHTDGTPICSTPSGGGTSQFVFTRTGATTLSISAGSTVVGHEVFSISSTAACTLTATDGDIAYFYLKDGIHYAAFYDTGSSVSCGSWVSITGVSEFPDDAVAIEKWTASSTPGNWDVSGGTSYQGSVRADIHKAGNGLSESSDANGVKTLAVNTANVPQFTSATADASGNCTTGQIWHRTDENDSWDCSSTNTWTKRAKAFYGSAGCEIDGGGSVITTGGKCVVVVPYSGTLYRWTVLETTVTPTASSSITIDVWKNSYSNYQPTVADSITGAGIKPNITSGTKGQSTSFTSWTTTTITAGDVLVFNVDSVTNALKVLVVLEIDRT